MDFAPFSRAVHARFTSMSANELFEADITGDDLFITYLAAFPEGTNLIYKTRTEHDCSCCKNFVKNIGGLVAIVDGQIQTVWDIDEKGIDPAYIAVARAMRDMVRSRRIAGLFRTKEHSYGAETSKQLLEGGMVKTWNHFHGKVAKKHYSKTPDAIKGSYATTVQVFRRGLEELTMESLDTVVELIEQKALYRGEEHQVAVVGFREVKRLFKAMTPHQQEIFVWANAQSQVARFRNTVIGTLVQDLSAGEDLEKAVRSFESKVAPTNYKRPTALITPRMVEDAMKTIRDLGLESALERRFAKITDIAVNNVLWVDRSVAGQMKGGIEGLLMKAAVSQPKETKAEDISVTDFFDKVLPQVSSMEMLVANHLAGNFVSLTAPAYDTVESHDLFKWNNGFAWSYDGNITDSIKERVKKAGGNVTNAKLRISLAWFNYDDLDIYVTEPNGNQICFHNKANKLDVDMNAGGRRQSREPVENVSWGNRVVLADGVYQVAVNNYLPVETDNPGFTIEIENQGKLVQLSSATSPRRGIHTQVASVTVKSGVVIDIKPAQGISAQGVSQEKWGVKTETFVPVQTLMLSPNHWDGNAVGNKHWFFILKDCKTDAPARGIYNEFLNSRLEKHRKVFEVLGDKTKCQPTEDQLSGLGFSSTRDDKVTLRVQGAKLQKTYTINF